MKGCQDYTAELKMRLKRKVQYAHKLEASRPNQSKGQKHQKCFPVIINELKQLSVFSQLDVLTSLIPLTNDEKGKLLLTRSSPTDHMTSKLQLVHLSDHMLQSQTH